MPEARVELTRETNDFLRDEVAELRALIADFDADIAKLRAAIAAAKRALLDAAPGDG